MNQIKRILSLIKPYRFTFVLSILFAVINVAMTLYVPILIGQGVDLVIGKGNVDFKGLFVKLIWILGAVVIASLCQWLMNLCNNRITYRVVQDVRQRAFNQLIHLPLKELDRRSHGDIISRIINDTDQFADGLLMGFSGLFTGIITILGTLIFMLSINLPITALVVLLTPLSFFVAKFIAKRTYSMFQMQSKVRGEMTSLVDEMVGNQKIVKIFAKEDNVYEQFSAINETLRTTNLRATFFSSLTNPSTRFINGLVYAGVGVLGAIMAIRGAISVGQLSCFLSYANQYTKPFNEISGIVTEFQNALASAGRVLELIDLEGEPQEESGILAHPEGKVECNHVSFSYQPEHPLIEDLNLHITPGSHVAIVGPTGCGKTTMINLLMRFYDVTDGFIQVDNKKIKEVTRDSLRSAYGMVLQETWLKSGTIAENIAYGKPDATREEIEEAAKAVHAHGFIRRMEHGYDTYVSESGGNLSAGQKQLLCIARVMLVLPPMLILDEATSSIDTRTEIRVQRAFRKMMAGRTSFIVAHRLSTIQEADLILVMKDGHIIEQGTHQELLTQKGFYYDLFHSQFG